MGATISSTIAMSLVDYADSSGEEGEGGSDVVSAPGAGILVDAAPAVDAFAPQAKILPSNTTMVEHNPTYESLYKEAEVGVCLVGRSADSLSSPCLAARGQPTRTSVGLL